MTTDPITLPVRPSRSPRLPAFTVSVLDAIRLAILCLPIWYILGLDQFIWPFIALFLFGHLIWQRSRRGRGIVLTPIARVGLVFVLIQIFAGLFIIEKEFYIVYARNVLAWGGGLLLLVVLVNVITTRAHLLRLLWSWVYILLFAGAVGLVSFLLRDGFQVKTLALYVVPVAMRDGITAATVWTRSFLAEPAPIAGHAWFRVRSFFLYSNSYAGVLVLAIPLIVYLVRLYRRFSVRWWLVSMTLVISVVNLLITTSRAGILSLVIGWGLWLLMRTRRRDWVLWMLLGLLLIMVVLASILIEPEQVVDSAVAYLDQFTTAKGRSHLTRFNILIYSLTSWRERPIFGWGTPREMSIYGFSPRYPRLGSHSQLLSVLYRTGIMGILIYAWLLVTLLRRLRSVPAGDWRSGFRVFLIWAVASNLVHSVFIQLDIELIFLYFVWQLWAMVDVLPRLSPSEPSRINSRHSA